MTREEYKNRIGWFKDHPLEVVHISAKSIDEIYNDFESRVCGECKWFQTHRYYIDIHDKVGYPQTVCEKLRINYGKDFGCNKFERKEEV